MATKTRIAGEERKIGHYFLREKIGSGGFGDVYKAYDPELEVERAIKLPSGGGDDVEGALQEAQNQAKMSHPAVVKVIDVEKVDGQWAIIMEWVGGGNLREKLQSGPLPLEDALQHCIDLASALAEAHKKNILHYDIKPENVLFDENGQVKLADFGISRRIHQAKIKMSRIIGTVEYMGPEQLDGMEDTRSEIWSLGALLYEMLTAECCFEDTTESRVIANIRKGRFVPLNKQNPSIPKGLREVVQKMLSLDVSKRYQTMEEVVSALKEFRDEEIVEERTSIGKWVLTLLIVNIVLSLAAGALYAHWKDLLNLSFLDRFGTVESVPLPETANRLDPEAQYREARGLIEKGDYPLAYQMLKNVEDGSEKKGLKEEAAFYKASLALNYLKDSGLALSEFKTFLEKYPGSPFAGEAHYFLGGIYLEQRKEVHKAIPHLTAVIEKYPNSTHAQSAEFLLQAAAKQVAEDQSGWATDIKSILKGLLPNNWTALVLSLFGLVSAIAIPIANLLEPTPAVNSSVKKGKVIVRHKRFEKKLILIVILTQIFSFTLNQFQNVANQQKSVGSLQKVGISVEKR